MTTLTDDPDLREPLNRLADDVANQSADFVWLVLSDTEIVTSMLRSDAKFARLMARAAASLPHNSFDWIMPPETLRRAIELARAEMLRTDSAAERRAILVALLTEPDPPFLSRLMVE